MLLGTCQECGDGDEKNMLLSGIAGPCPGAPGGRPEGGAWASARGLVTKEQGFSAVNEMNGVAPGLYIWREA